MVRQMVTTARAHGKQLALHTAPHDLFSAPRSSSLTRSPDILSAHRTTTYGDRQHGKSSETYLPRPDRVRQADEFGKGRECTVTIGGGRDQMGDDEGILLPAPRGA